MRITKIRGLMMAAVLTVSTTAAIPLVASTAHSATSDFTRQIASAGSADMASGPDGVDGLQWPELVGNGGDAGANRSGSVALPSGGTAPGTGGHHKSNPQVGTNFDGLNLRQQRLANGGKQFTVEPPDQGMCVGNGFVMESVNDVLRVFDKAGNPKTGVIDLNSFYGYIPQIDRTTGVQGPFVTDPACYFDGDTQRWFQTVLTLDVDPATGNEPGSNHLDIAVSKTADPTQGFNIYRIPVQDDGTQGTPNHHCAGGPCLGDYPHIGADASGFYITTNEYPLFADGYHAAQIYAISKHALAAGAPKVNVVQIDTVPGGGHDLAGNPGFTVWPSTAPGGTPALTQGSTEYFLSSTAAAEANGNGSSNFIGLWTLTNTASLDTATPAPALTNQVIQTEPYVIPPRANQKVGANPLGECLDDTTMPTPFGPGCWRYILRSEPAHNEVEYAPDANDTRMMQVFFANGKLWSALDTGVDMGNGDVKAGIAYFVVNPGSGKLKEQGYVSLPHNNLTYPTVASLENGRAVMSFTVLGDDYFPSVGYVGLDAISGTGPVQIVQSGAGPADGFSGYKAFGSPRARWGDYGAAATDGSDIWFATEYINSSCTLTQYVGPPFGSCGATRTALANWATHITQVTP